MATVRLGVIGFGRRLRSMLATLRQLEPDATVVALLDPRAEALMAEFPSELAGTARYGDVGRFLEHPGLEGVMVGTRCSLHTPYALEVLRSGLPMFLEKPVATSWEQLGQLAAASRSTKTPVVVSFPLRVSAMCELARRIVDSGAIGTVEQVQAVNNVPAYAAGYYHGWMRDEAETGGLWLQKATHDFDYLNYLVGQPPIRVCAMESKTVFRGDMPAGLHCVDCELVDCPEKPNATESWLCAFGVDTGNHDSASAIVQYASGMHLVYTQNFYTRRGAAARGATLIGYRGTLRFDWYQDELTVHHHHTGRVERHRFEAGHGETGHHGGDAELARDFLKIVAGKGVARTPLEVALTSVGMCLAARDSCREGRFVDVGAPTEVRA
ncbi:MAG TPA: Gfo/Idh/MocA family oxidoreductase [Chloroflexota bacterium]|jgi:predicted dehydrogenase|nr:Gfo/Idh/MocA family oxidoreductase [Chloroflexota bacterium]